MIDFFAQKKEHNKWINYYQKNVFSPITDNEKQTIIDAYGFASLQKILSIEAIELDIKDILRNRVRILFKKYNENEKFKKISTVVNTKQFSKIDLKKFNPFLYDINFNDIKTKIYRIDNSDYIVHIISKKMK